MAYCTSCGMALELDSNFCTECGTSVEGGLQQDYSASDLSKQKSELLMTLRPVFISRLAYMRSIPLLILGGFFISFLAGPLVTGIVGFFLSFFIGDFGYGIGMLAYGGLLIVGVPMFFHRNIKRTYEKTEYKIYNDKVEYAEGYMSITNKMARLNQVVDIRLKQGILQKKYGLGTIVMDMAASGNSISISDIKDSDKIYNQLQELLANH